MGELLQNNPLTRAFAPPAPSVTDKLQSVANNITSGARAVIDDMEFSKLGENTMRYIGVVDNNRTYYAFIIILISLIMFHTKYYNNVNEYNNKFFLVLFQLFTTVATFYFTNGPTPVIILIISWAVLIGRLRNLYKVDADYDLPESLGRIKNVFN
jgi:hypothetical protein